MLEVLKMSQPPRSSRNIVITFEDVTLKNGRSRQLIDNATIQINVILPS
jgi:hypothetical protein